MFSTIEQTTLSRIIQLEVKYDKDDVSLQNPKKWKILRGNPSQIVEFSVSENNELIVKPIERYIYIFFKYITIIIITIIIIIIIKFMF